MRTLPDWVFMATGWSIVMLALVLALWAMFWDRPRGRRRCPKCWYDMTASPGMRCSECGYEASSVWHLLKTRRMWRWLVAGVVAAGVGYVLLVTPRVQQVGWRGAVPTTALIWWVTHTEPEAVWDELTKRMSAPTKQAAELTRRAAKDQLWDWQWRWMLRRVEGVRSRERWPVDYEWVISVGLPHWLESIGRPQTSSPLEGAEDSHGIHLIPWRAGKLAAGTRAVERQRTVGPWSGEWTVPVVLVESADDAMTPVLSNMIDAAIRRSLDVGFANDPNPPAGIDMMVGARLFRSRAPILDDVAVGIVVELKRDAEVMKEWVLVMRNSPYGEPVDWIRFKRPTPGWNDQDAAEMDRWTVRVRGDVEAALNDLKRPRYWAGEYTVPLTDLLR